MLRRIYGGAQELFSLNRENAVEAYAAQAALFVVLSFFPAAILAAALLPLFSLSQTQVTGVFVEIVPEAIAEYAKGIVESLYADSSAPLISLTAVAALWTSSKGTVALIRGLDRIYGTNRTKGFLVLRLLGSLYELVFFLALVVILIFLGFGSTVFGWLSRWLPALKDSPLVKGTLQLIVSFAVLFVMIWFFYIIVPARRPRPLREIPGALVAAGGWVGYSALYSFYLDHVQGISAFYGSLSLLMFSLLWLYFCMYIFFVGAEVNVWLSKKRDKKDQEKEAEAQ